MLKEGSDVMENDNLTYDDAPEGFFDEIFDELDDGKDLVESEMFSFMKILDTKEEAESYIAEIRKKYPDHKSDEDDSGIYPYGNKFEASIDLYKSVRA